MVANKKEIKKGLFMNKHTKNITQNDLFNK